MSRLKLSRRHVLQLSAGASALLLPVLRGTRAEAQTSGPIRRLVFFHTPLGTIRDRYIPTGSETSFTLSPILQPLAPHKDKLLVIDGIDFGTTSRNHHEPGCLLTGRYVDGGDDAASRHSNISLDQYIRNKLPSSVRLKSLELMTFNRKPSALHADRNLFSARGPALPVIPEGDPLAAFDRVFSGVLPSGGGTTQPPAPDPALEALRADRRSVLDVVSKELSGLHARLSAAERAKLDQHLTAIRELEVRLQPPPGTSSTPRTGTSSTAAACQFPTKPGSTNVYENDSLPTRLKAFIEIVAYGMACDQFRVAVIANELAQGRASPTWVGYDTNWHDAFTHDKTGHAEHARIHTWYVQQFAYLVSLFKSIPEGTGTMLDHTALVLFSEQGCRYLSGGPTHHSAINLPFLVAGSCGGYFKQNRFVNVGGVLYKDLLFNFLHAMGYPENSFGNVTGTALPQLRA